MSIHSPPHSDAFWDNLKTLSLHIYIIRCSIPDVFVYLKQKILILLVAMHNNINISLNHANQTILLLMKLL